MGGVHKVGPQRQASASMSIAMSLSTGLGAGAPASAQAFAGPNGAQALASAGGLGSFSQQPGVPNAQALAGNFGPGGALPPGLQQGCGCGKGKKMKKLMRKMQRLMSKMQQLGVGIPGMPGAPGGGAFAGANPLGAFASAGVPGLGGGIPRLF